jgi:cephalosporin hydroxylase
MESLDTIFTKYNTDKGPGFHNYSRQYEPLLNSMRKKQIRILEIGVYNGGSLLAWRDAFPNAKSIVGVDIIPECKQYSNPSKSIIVEILDATQLENIQKIGVKYGPFDLIIDDGSHTNEHVIRSFEGFLPYLADGGIYIVEDTICYKSISHINPEYPTHIDYFTKFIPYLNQWRYDSDIGIKDHCVDPFKIQKKTSNLYERTIDKIEFGCSYIAIFKQSRHHWA